jgi:hypothetical protein
MKGTSTIKILLCSLFLLTATLFTRGAGNGSGVGVTLISYSLDTDVVNLGYTITISAQVTNFDSVPFNGPINFGLRNLHDTLTDAGVFGQPPYSGDVISLGANQTVPAIFTVNVNLPYFDPGPNVIVVWPICMRRIADSVLINIVVADPDPSSLKSLNAVPLTYAVVNNTILLKSTDATINFKQVRIYDVIGQKVAEVNSSYIATVQLPQLPHGIYLCQLVTADGRRTTIKFVAGN